MALKVFSQEYRVGGELVDQLERDLEYAVSREEAIQCLKALSLTRKEAELFLDAPDELTRRRLHQQVKERVERQDLLRRAYHASWFGRNDEWLMPALGLTFVLLIITIMFLVL